MRRRSGVWKVFFLLRDGTVGFGTGAGNIGEIKRSDLAD
jgi:hypothetical protein